MVCSSKEIILRLRPKCIRMNGKLYYNDINAADIKACSSKQPFSWNDHIICVLLRIDLQLRIIYATIYYPLARKYEITWCCPIQYIPRNMHTVFALLCFVVVIHWLIFPYPSGLLHWHCGNLTIAPVPAKQPWWIWINTSCEFIMNDCITTNKYTVCTRGQKALCNPDMP